MSLQKKVFVGSGMAAVYLNTATNGHRTFTSVLGVAVAVAASVTSMATSASGHDCDNCTCGKHVSKRGSAYVTERPARRPSEAAQEAASAKFYWRPPAHTAADVSRRAARMVWSKRIYVLARATLRLYWWLLRRAQALAEN